MASAQVKSCVLLAGLYADGPHDRASSPCRPATTPNACSPPPARRVAKRQATRLGLAGRAACALGSTSVPGDFSAAAPFLVAATLLPGSRADDPRRRTSTRPAPACSTCSSAWARASRSSTGRRAGGEPVADLEVRSAAARPRPRSTPSEVPRLVDELPLFALAAALRPRRERRPRRRRAAREGDGPDRNRDDCATEPSACASLRRDDGFRVRGRPDPLRAAARWARTAITGSRCSARSRGSSRAKACELEGAEAVAVSFPGFFDLLESVTQTMIVAIDGPAGAGKSTVARRLAERLGFRYLDTGAMYRALTWLAMQGGLPLGKGERLGELARENPVELRRAGARLRSPAPTSPRRSASADIDRIVPVVARHPEVREVMRARQRELADDGDVVIEGRDIGTVVAPAAPR